MSKEKKMKAPSINGHFYVSLVKSILRIGAGLSLMSGQLMIAGLLFIAAEILGIVEELV